MSGKIDEEVWHVYACEVHKNKIKGRITRPLIDGSVCQYRLCGSLAPYSGYVIAEDLIGE